MNFKDPRILVDNYIRIETYQHIEKKLLEEDRNYYETVLAEFSYVVYDECHYFYNDSNFNTNTELSYDFLRNKFNCTVQIFMSATIDNMTGFIKTWCGISRVDDYLIQFKSTFQGRILKYEVSADYKYINLILYISKNYYPMRILIYATQRSLESLERLNNSYISMRDDRSNISDEHFKDMDREMKALWQFLR